MYGGGVKHVMCNGTRWIDHKVRAMGRTVEKFGLYIQHLRGTIPTVKPSNDRAIVQGKPNELVDATVLLRSAFLSDVLTEAKRFSLISQKNISMCQDVERSNMPS